MTAQATAICGIEAAELLRPLLLGGEIVLASDGWRFAENPPGAVVWPIPLPDHHIERLLERGLAQREDYGRRLRLAQRGRDLLCEMDDRALQLVRAMSDKRSLALSALKQMAEDLKNRDDLDHRMRIYTISGIIIRLFLGLEWMEKHIMGTTAPTSFFRNACETVEDQNMHQMRVIHLAEMLFNLKIVPGFNSVLERLKTADVEATFAELEVGKLLMISRLRPYRFVSPANRKGDDYDLEIVFGETVVAADTKCKIETTPRGVSTVVTSLKNGRSQVPEDRPAIFFVKLPQSWNPQGTDDSTIKMMEEIAAEFFAGKGAYRGTGHIVSLKFYFSLTLDFAPTTVAILLMKEIDNPTHRHQPGVDWTVFSDMNSLPEFWVDLTKIAA